MSPSSPAGSSSSSIEFTNTLLALPDGAIPAAHPDRSSHTISLIGGYPTFPPLPSPKGKEKASEQAPTEVRCGICHKPMPLLAQVYCPPENGENDRTLYVWGCARAGCQKREGSIRAYRASVRNEEYVRDVEEKRKLREKEEAEEREKARKNPFTLGSDAAPNGSALFGSAQPLFGGAASAANPFAAPTTTTPADPVPDLASLTISEPLPPSGPSTTLAPPLPAYQPPQYLSTIEEYLIPPEDVEMDSDSDEDETPEQAAEWKEDGWEKLLPKGVDEVFEAFVRRLGQADGGKKQVLRYELGGMPLPYSSQSPLTKRLFPGAEKPLGKDDELDLAALYTTQSVPPCPRCKSKRTFELQLVPSLINLLRPHTLSTTGEPGNVSAPTAKSEEERKKELARLAAGAAEKAEDEGEMEWGNVVVFGCERDCVGVGEEWVGVEWESGLDH
ncbi:hypothetical protein IAT38_006555 [Cryptococcus sp. DSM 104549]